MAELTAAEKLERAKNSIAVAEERLTDINHRIPELNRELDDLLVTHEIQGYKGRTIERTQTEITNLKKEKETLEKTIDALKKKLPDMERDERVEIAETETVSEYREALAALTGLVEAPVSDDELKEAISKIQEYAVKLSDAQKRFFTSSQQINESLIKENLQNISGIDTKTLRDTAKSLNYKHILILSDRIIDYGKELNRLQYSLFRTGTAILRITEPPLPHIKETCSCGLHKREFDPTCCTWHMWEHRQSPTYLNKWDWQLIHREGGFKDKPVFPCEIPNVTVLKKKDLTEKTSNSLHKDIPGKMVYGPGEKAHDPDKTLI